ncbi:MAG: hypothetical protein EPO21_03850 [Chloroflexota bacterium]|nr:MAG: hypothetical protein EPO21_03850 [Chloroflexota bacterium]
MGPSRTVRLWHPRVEPLASRRGQALVETALAISALLLVLLTGLDVYLYAWDVWRVQEVAREAVAATIDAPSEATTRAWLEERVADEVAAKALRTSLDGVEFTLPDGGGYAPGSKVLVTIRATHRFQFGMHLIAAKAPIAAQAAGLVRRNRNWQ